MAIRDAAREIGVTEVAVRYHDPKLKPVRTSSGMRIYDRVAVIRFAARRDHARDRQVGH